MIICGILRAELGMFIGTQVPHMKIPIKDCFGRRGTSQGSCQSEDNLLNTLTKMQNPSS